ncbi:hypothetical protein [Cupriavidus nantongensis]|uniref:Uncharacterized protein n=1 Tax=Cupriavidus nantongensis TaxID=1796606 RepID=A0A142JIR2_9BURK|nr:hypothetical protein [Cupriavidus nantongensis]AMR77974.1 hypothetical protein A2G96_09605 [Cupriavidus nantongensis]
MKFISILVLALTLAACGNAPSSLNGNYRANDGKSFLVFSSDGKVRTKTLLGKEVETTYTIADKKVSFQFPNGLPASYSINDDGSLSAPWSSGYKKG